MPSLQAGVHPSGMLPLLTRLPIVLMVTAVLQRELIDGFRLFTNVLSLLFSLAAGELSSVMLVSVFGVLLTAWCGDSPSSVRIKLFLYDVIPEMELP